MDELRFDAPVGTMAIGPRDNGLMLVKELGAHSLRLQLEVKTSAAAEAGRVLVLDTTLYAPFANGPRGMLGTATATVAFRPNSVERPELRYMLTSAQVRALDEHRFGDLRLELDVRATLPQATSYPGSSATLYIAVAESRWRQQIEGLGPSLAVEMSVPFPAGDDERQEAVRYLQEAQRRLRDDDVDGAMLEARRTLEYIRLNSGWLWPGNKPSRERTQDERWAWIRAALEDQASGALHKDAVTKTFKYSRTEAETTIAMAAALLRLLD
ncbi:hypothetical protein N8I84_41600 (plasmid) [Streptomyces cynarae]|uniref:PE-PGRS family protein n=1 Tax=Streptomyces cynarae TaxID=2981134 RepID=A0ABY6EE62_9ACTN|nr:hypothetical protein [Streptomyces cynarae]UXY24939.1 hypothetical protein N8I84_41600 [Streptomyces cynarae]